MKRIATGRIVFWRGGSLWIGLAGEPTGFHAHHAVQISLALPGSHVQFRKPAEPWTSYTAALVEADQSHAFGARAQRVAQIFVDPESHDGRQLQRRHRNEGIVALPSGVLDQQIVALATAYEEGASNTVLIALARAVSATLSGSIPEPKKVPDARIDRALVLIRERLISRTFKSMFGITPASVRPE